MVANAAEDDANAVADACDACNASLEAAEDQADATREHLWAAKQEAVWFHAVVVLVRLRAAKRRALWSEAPVRAPTLSREECSRDSMLEEGQDVLGGYEGQDSPRGRVAGSAKGESVAPVVDEEEVFAEPEDPAMVVLAVLRYAYDAVTSTGGGDDGRGWWQFDLGGSQGQDLEGNL